MLDYAVKTMCFDAACTKQLFSGRYYSIVLVTRGTARFHWEAERWICSTEDLFLFKPGEGAVMVFPGGKLPLEMLWVQLSPESLAALSDEATQLEAKAWHAAWSRCRRSTTALPAHCLRRAC